MKQQQRVVIVGASSGIGRALALHYLADGARVGLAARREHPLAEIAAQYPHQVEVATIDVTHPEADSQLLALVAQLGGMDVCIISAGIGYQNVELNASLELSTVATNTAGFTRIAVAAFNHFRTQPQGGHLVALSSIAGTKGLGVSPSYSATKRYQSTYMESLTQLATIEKLPIRTTVIKPGFIDTPLIEGANYPCTLSLAYASRLIYKAICKKRSVVVVNWVWRTVVLFWRLIPRWLWVRLSIK